MTHSSPLTEERLERLRAVFHGPLLTPNDEGYDQARRVWNGQIDRHPALIARCLNASDVVEAVHFARENHLLTAVRGGGHSFAGFSVCDDGMVIDLGLLKEIQVDADRRTVRVGAGVSWGELDAATQALGLAVTGGLVSHTGVAGLTLGGGIGWLMRKHGLTCDNLLSVDVVTAEGGRITSSPEQNAELFWGLRGGGGNFGVVTSFEFRLHEMGPVLGGLVFHRADDGPELLRAYRHFTATAPDEISTMLVYHCAPPLPFVPEHLHGCPVWAFVLCGLGPIDKATRSVASMRTFGHPLFEMVGPMRYTELQSMFDASAEWGTPTYLKSNYLATMSDPAIDVLAAHCAAMPLGRSQVHIHHMGGAVNARGEDDMAFSGRSAAFCDNLIAMWDKDQEAERYQTWVRRFWDELQPHAMDQAYLNFNAGPTSDAEILATYGRRKHERLTALKGRYDSTNLFCLNQNIRAPGKPSSGQLAGANQASREQ